jgi:hypothetical protein
MELVNQIPIMCIVWFAYSMYMMVKKDKIYFAMGIICTTIWTTELL